MIQPAHVRARAPGYARSRSAPSSLVAKRDHPPLTRGDLLVRVEPEHRRVTPPPHGVPSACCAPSASHASSTTPSPCLAAMPSNAGMSAGYPKIAPATTPSCAPSLPRPPPPGRGSASPDRYPRTPAAPPRTAPSSLRRQTKTGSSQPRPPAPRRRPSTRDVARRSRSTPRWPRRPHARRKRPLELPHARPQRELTRTQDLEHRPLLRLTQHGPRERDHRVSLTTPRRDGGIGSSLAPSPAGHHSRPFRLHPVLQRVHERIPGGRDHVLRDPDRPPHLLPIGRVDQDARHRTGALVSSRIRTLKFTSSMSRNGMDLADRVAQRACPGH